MPYTQTSWVNGTTPVNATNQNHLETQFAQAMTSLNLDVFPTGLVLSGLVASKDAVTATKLNVTAGRAYLIQADGNNDSGARAVASSSQTTVTINTTYNLYLQPDGTWYWSTSNSPAANSLYIATVSTDGSGNIKTVTDKRPLTTAILSAGVLVPVLGGAQMAASVTPSQAGNVLGGVTFGGAAAIAGDASAASASFNGTTGYVLGPSTSLPTGNAAWSLEGWVKIAANPSAISVIASFGTFATHQMAVIYIDTSGIAHAGTFNGDTTGGTALSLNTWHHIVGTWDGTTIKCFVDGAAYGTNATPGAMTIPANPPLGIGAYPSASNFLPGSVAEAAFYSSALALARITAHFTAGTAGGYAAAVASDTPLRYYRLGEPVGALYANSSIASTLQTLDSAGASTLGRVASLGGQAAVGVLGAPVIVAQAIGVKVTATTSQTLINAVSIPAGIYRISGAFTMNNGTSPQLITFSWGYNTRTFGQLNPAGNLTIFTSATAFAALNGTNASVSNGDWIILPQVFEALAGTLTVNYRDPGGTPADTVNVIIERLA